MRGAPPRAVEAAVGLLIPLACRQEVLGDLHERYVSPGQYIREALRTAPLVIVSRIWRIAGIRALLMEALLLYLSFVVAARYGDRSFLGGEWGPLWLAVPAAIALAAMLLEDAYARPGKRSALELVRGPALGLGAAFLSQSAIPRLILLYGAAIGWPLVSTVRIWFGPPGDRPVGRRG